MPEVAGLRSADAQDWLGASDQKESDSGGGGGKGELKQREHSLFSVEPERRGVQCVLLY